MQKLSTFIIGTSALLSAFCVTAQTQIQFANRCDLQFEFQVQLIVGNAAHVTQGQDSVRAWETCNQHDLGDQVQTILQNLPIHHYENKYVLECERNTAGDTADSYQVQVDVLHNQFVVFSMLVEQTDDGSFQYNLMDTAGTLDVASPYVLQDNQGNDPHDASFSFAIDSEPFKVVYGTFDAVEDDTDNIIYAITRVNLDTLWQIEPDPAVLEDPTQLNVVSYNPGFLKPVGFNDQEDNERAQVFHQGIPDNIDIIVFQEFFEDDLNDVILPNLIDKYPYQSGSHNAPLIPFLTKGGGVRILSKHPILEEGEISYSENGSTSEDFFNQFADKGVKYVKINKHGQIIHVFGTHTNGLETDLMVMGMFLSQYDIPKEDIVIHAGDFNMSLFNSKYYLAKDTLKTIDPTISTLAYDIPYRGSYWGITNHYSDGSVEDRNYLDYVFSSAEHKVPTTMNNITQVYQVINDDPSVWGVFSLGDHQPVFAHMEFPSVQTNASDTVACPGDMVSFSIDTDLEYDSLVWYKDDVRLGQLGENMEILDFQEDDWGSYWANAYYTYLPDTALNSTPDTRVGTYQVPEPTVACVREVVEIVPDPPLCPPSSIDEYEANRFNIYPNPATDAINLDVATNTNDQWLLKITDTAGRDVLVRQITDFKNVDLPELSAGSYWVSLSKDKYTRWSKLVITEPR